MTIETLAEYVEGRLVALNSQRHTLMKRINANGGRYSGKTNSWEQVLRIDAKVDELNQLKNKLIPKSQSIEAKAHQEENEGIALGLYLKAQKEKKLEFFKDQILPDLAERGFSVITINESQFRIEESQHGKIDIYPKSGKVHIHKGNQWIKDGISWISKNLK